jgi:anti-sigma factor RsiW
MSRACAVWRGDVGAYLVGALDDDARARVIAHLETCAGCRSDYDELAPVRGLLSQLAGPDAAPRAGGPGRFWGQPPGGVPLPPLRPVRGAARRWLAGAAIAVAAGAVAVLAAAGLPAGGRCVMLAVAGRGSDIAGTWSATYDGTARVAGTSAIPLGRLTSLRIESAGGRLLLTIPVRPPGHGQVPAMPMR